jgi:hypothetical protein
LPREYLVAVLSAIVVVAVEREVRATHAPARENAREFSDVRLRVAAVHAHRVQLHDLTRVVLIWRGKTAQVLIEIHQHRRALRCGAQQIRKLAQGERTNHVAIVDSLADTHLVDADREVIGPEVDHALLQLLLGERRAIERRVLQLVVHFTGVLRHHRGVGQAEHWIVGAHERVDRGVVECAGIELRIEVGREAHLFRGRNFSGGEPRRDATNESHNGIAPAHACLVGQRGAIAGFSATRLIDLDRLRVGRFCASRVRDGESGGSSTHRQKLAAIGGWRHGSGAFRRVGAIGGVLHEFSRHNSSWCDGSWRECPVIGVALFSGQLKTSENSCINVLILCCKRGGVACIRL